MYDIASASKQIRKVQEESGLVYFMKPAVHQMLLSTQVLSTVEVTEQWALGLSIEKFVSVSFDLLALCFDVIRIYEVIGYLDLFGSCYCIDQVVERREMLIAKLEKTLPALSESKTQFLRGFTWHIRCS